MSHQSQIEVPRMDVSHNLTSAEPTGLEVLNKVCFTTCIVCTVLGMVLSLAMIWGEIGDSGFVWKSWLTLGVFFCSSATTLSVSRTLRR